MDKKNWLKSMLISIVTCLVGAGLFSIAIIVTAPKKTVEPVKTAAAATAKADPNAIPPLSIVGTWEMTSPKLGQALITFEKDGTIKYRSNGMNILGKYAVEFQDKTIVVQLIGIVDGTVMLFGEMTDPGTIKWREIKGWDLGSTPVEWVKK